MLKEFFKKLMNFLKYTTQYEGSIEDAIQETRDELKED